ncbi:asparaginase [Cuneatibacter caecimuris]|uniref:asparaginase n=1 Tax=Cuneatibacter caecimuris TaxID=1796618 RepID=A0A4Q7PNH6_9FIRM|nr:asparaginase [Cuneatibacter caecimuris]RZT02434.1 L-asparaginase [Cuneatibacter caecimuris]
MKKILMIGTGGTIASRQTEGGLAPGLTTEELLSFIPQAAEICRIETMQLCSIDSTNMTPGIWLEIAGAVEAHYTEYDGFVICHGTDTLAYTSAALSYLIQDSAKPVVITGAQRPIDKDITDAKTNLLDSFLYAADSDSTGVNIVFDGKVIAGTRARKMRAKSYNAFSSINFPSPAVIQDGKVIRYFKEEKPEGPVRFYHKMSDSICVLKLIPGLKPELLAYLFENYRCIVIESFGVGGIPEGIQQEFYRQMKEWHKKGKFVVMATQVVNEGSNMAVYEVGQKVKKDFDLIEAYDMTLEATVTKLMWLMARPGIGLEEIRSSFYRTINHDILFTREWKEDAK